MLGNYFQDSENFINYGHNTAATIQEFHLHERFEIYFFISGDVNYFIEKKSYKLKYGDLFIMNNREIHRPFVQSNKPYERIVIHFDPKIPQLLSSPDFDLLHCFKNRTIGEQNKISLSKNQIDEILKIFDKIENLNKNTQKAYDILKLTYFVELLVYINMVFSRNIENVEELTNVPEKLIPILDYIDSNLDGDLSLATLGNLFYIDKSYLSRLFKKSIGSNIHQYIIYKRLSKAKIMLSEGHSVTDTCMNCGFNDYSNFIRTFKKAVGIPPGEYRKLRGS